MANFISKQVLKFFEQTTLMRFLWLATVLVIIITFFVAFNKVRSSPQLLALHYNVVIGVDVLGSKARLYQIPLTALAIAVLNLVLIKLLRLRQKFLPLVLVTISLVCALLTLAAILFLYSVN